MKFVKLAAISVVASVVSMSGILIWAYYEVRVYPGADWYWDFLPTVAREAMITGMVCHLLFFAVSRLFSKLERFRLRWFSLLMVIYVCTIAVGVTANPYSIYVWRPYLLQGTALAALVTWILVVWPTRQFWSKQQNRNPSAAG